MRKVRRSHEAPERIRISRRGFLKGASGAVGFGLLASACRAASTAEVVKETVEVPVEVEVTRETVVEVEKVVPPTSKPAPAGPKQIEVIFVADAGLLPIWEQVFSAFEEEHPDIQVNRQLTPEEGYAERLLTQVAGGIPPDICYTHPSILPALASQGVLMPLDDLAAADVEFQPEDVYPEIMRYSQHKGKTYGYPFLDNPTIYYYNKTLCDDMGVEYPSVYAEGYAELEDEWTWDKVVEWGLKLSKGEGPERTFGYWPMFSSLHWMCSVIYSYGGQPWNDDLTTCMLSESAAIDALTEQAKLFTEHNIAPLPAQMQGLPYGFWSGKAGLLCWGRAILPGLLETPFEVGMVPSPKGPAGRVNRDGPEGEGISADTQQLEAAWTWLSWLVGPRPGELGGMEHFLAGRRSTPVRQSTASSAVYQDNLLPWEDSGMYTDAATRVRYLPMPDRYSEINTVWREQWDSVLLGQKGVEEATEVACQEIDKLLAEA